MQNDELKWVEDGRYSKDAMWDLEKGDRLVGWAHDEKDRYGRYVGYTDGYVFADTFEELKALVIVTYRMRGDNE